MDPGFQFAVNAEKFGGEGGWRGLERLFSHPDWH
jgi:hypothetical protein